MRAAFLAQCNATADALPCPALQFRSLLDPLVAGIRGDHSPLTMQQLGRWGEFMHIGGGCFHGVDEACLAIHTDVILHPVTPQVTLLGLMHLCFPLPCLFLAELGAPIRALLQGHTVGLQMGFHRLKNLLA